MPFVIGFLRKIRRPTRPGRPVDPDYGVDEGDGVTDPDYGIDEGDYPEVSPPVPDGPPGIWPPLTPEHPWRPIGGWRPPGRPGQGLPSAPPAPGQGLPPTAGQPLPPTDGGEVPDTGFPPGAVWPPLPPDVHGKYLALVLVAGMPGVKYRYVVIDADAVIPPAGGAGRPPARPTPQ